MNRLTAKLLAMSADARHRARTKLFAALDARLVDGGAGPPLTEILREPARVRERLDQLIAEL